MPKLSPSEVAVSLSPGTGTGNGRVDIGVSG